MSEKQIENLILCWLNHQYYCFAFKVNTVGVFDPIRKIYRKNKNRFLCKGTSDIICVYRGFFVAIEVKTKQGQVTEDQRAFLTNVGMGQGHAIVARNLEDVQSLIGYLENLISARSQTSLPLIQSDVPQPS